MAGRITASETQLRPDPRFNDKVLAKFINCIMQATFIYVIATTDLSQPEYIAEDVVELRHWRRRVAHAIENFDRISDLSLASRVCTGDSGLSVRLAHSRHSGGGAPTATTHAAFTARASCTALL